MEAIVLAGGLGTRLRSVVNDVPKPMAPIGGRPFLELLFASLSKKGVNRIVVSVGYKSEAIIAFFREYARGPKLDFIVETNPLGTGGAIAFALRHVTTDHVLILNGDTYLDVELDMLKSMWPGDRSPIVVVREIDDSNRYGRIDVRNGRVVKFSGVGIPGPGLINAGCYVVPKEIFDSELMPAAFSFENDFLALRNPGSLRAYVTKGQFIDIGIPEDFRRAQVELAGLAS